MRQRGVATGTAGVETVTASQPPDDGVRTAPSRTAAAANALSETGGAAPAFQFATWAVFVAQVWLLDFGRPFFALYLSNGTPLSQLSISEYSGLFLRVIFCDRHEGRMRHEL